MRRLIYTECRQVCELQTDTNSTQRRNLQSAPAIPGAKEMGGGWHGRLAELASDNPRERCVVVVVSVRLASIRVDTSTSHTSGTYLVLVRYDFQLDMHFNITELELELILSRWLWERGEKGGASLQKQARVRALCGVMQ